MQTATLESPESLHDSLLPRANIRPVADFSDQAKFLTVQNVPIFVEHETVTKKGRTLRFSRHELQAVVNNTNRRIRDTGDPSGICIGHLPDASDLATNGTPPIVGLADNFRIGLLGEEDPKYAIICDFHMLVDGCMWDGEKLSPEKIMAKFPRRSCELWVSDRYEDMLLDPVCLLGAECPRLDMGLVYAADRTLVERYSALYSTKDGREVERYSACAPAAGNVFLPGDGKKKYAAVEPTNEPITTPKDKPMASNLSPEDIQEIVNALMQTEQMSWVTQQMQAAPGPEAAPAAPLEVPAEPVPPPAPEAAPPAAPAAAEPPPPMPAAAEPPPSPSDAAPEVPAPAAAAGPDEPEKVKESAVKPYAAGCDPSPSPRDKSGVSAVKYSRQQAEISDMQRQLAELTEQLAAARRDISVANEAKANVERFSRLSELRRVRKFDLDREFERCNYSKMDSQRFEDHLSAIKDNYTAIPLDMTLPTPDLPVTDNPARPGAKAEKVAYSKECHDKAYQIAKKRRMNGEDVDYKAIVQQVHEGKL